ncbi:ferric reductase transmembrane component [Coprinopsis sp. MPI-PUGE-AT-0042]|nr:ferric reductase transmembrane component [Coprinopsis sp. MPI-PUGE-AT-0042]
MATVQNGPVPDIQDPSTIFHAQLIRSTTLVWRVSLFIYAILIAYAVFRIPHLVGLFGSSSEWYTGHFLWYKAPKRPKGRVGRNDSSRTLVGRHNSTKSVVGMARKESSRTVVNEDGSYEMEATTTRGYTRHPEKQHRRPQYHKERSQPIAEEMKAKFPTHIPSVHRLLRPALTVSRIRVFKGYSIAQLVMMVLYFIILVCATFFQSNPFVDATRPAWVAVSQMPLLFALAQKNNILGSIMGYGYEKLNFLHRFAARVVILASNIHAIYYFYKWTLEGTFMPQMLRATNAWGMACLIFLDLIYLLSSSFFRNNYYNLFLWSHMICFSILVPAVYLHQKSLLPYVLTCAFLYAFDRVARILKTRIKTATIIEIPQLDATHVEIPSLNAGWRAGQHVRLRILSTKMGWLGWTEMHPFTIASSTSSPDACLTLLCKQSGDWTKALAQLAKQKDYSVDGQGQVKVMIEGPYGGPSRMVFSSFSAALLVVGGSGITFGLSMVQDLVEKDLRGESRLKWIELVWSCSDAASVVPLVPIFTELVEQSVLTPLKITIHYTKAMTSKLPIIPPHVDPTGPITLHPNVTLAPGRPRLGKALDLAIARAASLESADAVGIGETSKDAGGIKGVAVGVCGPKGFGDEIVRAVNGIDSARREQVGGVEVHEEEFGW